MFTPLPAPFPPFALPRIGAAFGALAQRWRTMTPATRERVVILGALAVVTMGFVLTRVIGEI
jgi:hypothetical protein